MLPIGGSQILPTLRREFTQNRKAKIKEVEAAAWCASSTRRPSRARPYAINKRSKRILCVGDGAELRQFELDRPDSARRKQPLQAKSHGVNASTIKSRHEKPLFAILIIDFERGAREPRKVTLEA